MDSGGNASEAGQPSHRPMDRRARRGLLVLGVAVLVVGVGLAGHRVLVDDGSSLIDDYQLTFNGSKAESCGYDAENERMTVLALLEADLTGPVEFTITAGVRREGTEAAAEPDGAQASSTVVLESGRSRAEVPIVFPLSQEDHDAGWTRCYLAIEHDRAEFWD